MSPPQRTVQKGTSSNLNRRSQFQRPASQPAFVFRPPPLFPNMDTSVLVSLLALVVAMAGVTRALHIQGSLDKDDLLSESEEKMADNLLKMVRT